VRIEQAEIDRLAKGVEEKAGPEIAMRYREIVGRANSAQSLADFLSILQDAKKLLGTTQNKAQMIQGKQNQ
jgi:hypothetical protein